MKEEVYKEWDRQYLQVCVPILDLEGWRSKDDDDAQLLLTIPSLSANLATRLLHMSCRLPSFAKVAAMIGSMYFGFGGTALGLVADFISLS